MPSYCSTSVEHGLVGVVIGGLSSLYPRRPWKLIIMRLGGLAIFIQLNFIYRIKKRRKKRRRRRRRKVSVMHLGCWFHLIEEKEYSNDLTLWLLLKKKMGRQTWTSIHVMLQSVYWWLFACRIQPWHWIREYLSGAISTTLLKPVEISIDRKHIRIKALVYINISVVVIC